MIEVGRALCVRNSDFILTIKIDNVIGVICRQQMLLFSEWKSVKESELFCVIILAEKAGLVSMLGARKGARGALARRLMK